MEGHLNYLFFVPSLLSGTQHVVYRAEVEDIEDTSYPEYEGLQTNEAVTKFLIDYLHNEGERLDKIIMLCTPEVLNTPLKQIEGQTTCEYYKGEIEEFIWNRNYTEMVEMDHLFEVVPYYPKNNENENQIITHLEKIVQPREKGGYSKRLFVDFTGGNRSSALTMVFACRILNQAGLEVGKILYSNLRKTENGLSGIIEECTRTYQIFSNLEQNLKLNNGIVGDGLEFAGKHGEELNENLKELMSNDNMNQMEQVREIAGKVESLVTEIDIKEMSYTQQQTLEIAQELGKKKLEEAGNPLLRIRRLHDKGEDMQALTLFRENIIQILYSNNIIQVNGRHLYRKGTLNSALAANEIVAAYNYYNDDNKTKGTLMRTAREYVHHLHDNPELSPKEVKERYFGEDYYKLQKYMSKASSKGKSFKHNSFSRRKSLNFIMPYLKELYNQNRDLEECFQQYFVMDQLYMEYGFPFACTYGKENYFDGYEDFYRKLFEKGVDSLQGLFEGKPDEKIARIMDSLSPEMRIYKGVLQVLCDEQHEQHEEMLRILFPFRILTRNMKSDTLDWTSWNEFIYLFAQSYQIIKILRNASVHTEPLEQKKRDRALEEFDKLLTQIENIVYSQNPRN